MTTSPEALREAVERLTQDLAAREAYIKGADARGVRADQCVDVRLSDLRTLLSALQEARADADLCASSWTKEIEARNATASIARRFHAALQEIASGEVGPEQEGHYLAHRRAVKTARKAIGALSPGGAEQ